MLILLSAFMIPNQRIVFAESIETIEDVELLIRENKLTQDHYISDFKKISKGYNNELAYQTYLNGVWLAHIRNYEEALVNFYETLELLKSAPDNKLEMLVYEKLLELHEISGNLIDYQENAFRLRTLSAGIDDKLYVKALYAIADAHYLTYNDETARNYLSAIFDESERMAYDFGFSRYHKLYGDIELSYGNVEDAKYHYQKAYIYGIPSDELLSFPYMEMLELKMVQIDSIEGNHQRAYERLKVLLEGIEQKAPYMQRDIYYQLGIVASDLALYEEAIDFFNDALLSDYLVDKTYKGYPYCIDIYLEMGSTYSKAENFTEALRYYEMAIETERNSNSDEYQAEQVSALNAYEIDELEREIAFKQRLREANEQTIEIQGYYLKIASTLVILLLLCLGLMFYIIFLKSRVQRKLYQETITDHLTKVFSRSHIIDMLASNINNETCLMMMDLDDFKMINDTFGHLVGDRVLVRTAQTIKSNLRDSDYCGRYGGEEFLVVLKNTNLENGLVVAERIRKAIEYIKWEEDFKTTLSIGILQCHEGEVDDLLAEADILMYRAKRQGKNKVVF